MERVEIEGKLSNLLTGFGRKIVFWYDDDGSYEEEISEYQLPEGCKLHILTMDNWFMTKKLIEMDDIDSNYLIYAPFPRPKDQDNYLVDMYYYADHFYSDKLIQLSGDLNIPVEYQDSVKKYKKFWNSSNSAKYEDLHIEMYSDHTVELGMMAVLAGIKIVDFEELLRKVILAEEKAENTIMKKLKSLGLDTVFFELAKNQYGYYDDNPSVLKLLTTMLVTYTATLTEDNIPKDWECFAEGRKNDCVVFVKNIMNNKQTTDCYDYFAAKISDEIKVEKQILKVPLVNLVECDTFEAIDENLISWIAAKLGDGMLDEKIGDLDIPAICESRVKDSYHFAEKYRSQYEMLEYAYKLLKGIDLYEFKPSVKEVLDEYVEETYKIDTYYRKFYYYMDKTGISEEFETIRDLVENTYTNRYLSNITYKWNQILTDDAYQQYPYAKQEDFYKDFVQKKRMKTNGKVFVIISDGMRYECAKELMNRFAMDEKCEANISSMLSVLPSETTLGMASLLPHSEIRVSDSLNVTVDDKPCGNSMEDRRKILQSKVDNAECYQMDVVRDAGRSQWREMVKGKEVIYIYQDQIDGRGEKRTSENEVFNACEEAIAEIYNVIRKITNDGSGSHFIVTADHGFIYKRNKLEESDKISLDKKEIPFVNKRYMLSNHAIVNDATVSRMLTYLSKMNQLFVTTPMGADIIKTPGGGQNYVHGGSSLQEMVVPVIEVDTDRYQQKDGFVKVELSTFNTTVSSTVFKIDFMQMEAVTDKKKGRELVAFFEDGDRNRISYEVPVIANSREKDASKRLITEKFVLKGDEYRSSDDYFLVVCDRKNEKDEVIRQKFTIDIPEYMNVRD